MAIARIITAGGIPLHQRLMVLHMVDGEVEHLAHRELAEQRMRQQHRIEFVFGPRVHPARKRFNRSLY